MKKVFLDTEVFQSIQYNLENKRLKILLNLQSINVFNLNITSINNEENIQRINKKLDEIRREFKKRKSDYYILNSIESFRENINLPKIEEYKAEILERYNTFIREKFNVINYDNLSINKIMEAYFYNSPPFDKEEKKHEFPDAISFLMIVENLEPTEEAYIISNDHDITGLINTLGYSERIHQFKNLEEFLNDYNKEKDFYENFIRIIEEEDFSERINEEFENINFYASGFYDPYIDHVERINSRGIDNVKITPIAIPAPSLSLLDFPFFLLFGFEVIIFFLWLNMGFILSLVF